MISISGVVAGVIFLISVGALILHRKVMVRRGALDDAYARLDELLRERLGIIYENAAQQNVTEVCRLCEPFFSLETRELLKAFDKVKMENAEVLAEIVAETDEAIANFNESVSVYNAYIAKFPAREMAKILGLEPENAI